MTVKRYTTSRGESFHQYIEFDGDWFLFCDDLTNINGIKRTISTVELNKSNAATAIAWMIYALQEEGMLDDVIKKYKKLKAFKEPLSSV